MKKTALYTVTAIAILALTAPAFAKGGNGERGSGNGAYANSSNRGATQPACDGTGPKGKGTIQQRPMDGSGNKYRQKRGSGSQPTTQTPVTQTPTTPAN